MSTVLRNANGIPAKTLFQECKFHVGSYIHDNTQIRFTGTCNHDFENQRAQQYQINITDLDQEESFIMWANRNYSQTGFKVGLYRTKVYSHAGWALPSIRKG